MRRQPVEQVMQIFMRQQALGDRAAVIRSRSHERLRMQARREAQARQRAASRKGAAINDVPIEPPRSASPEGRSTEVAGPNAKKWQRGTSMWRTSFSMAVGLLLVCSV